MHIYLINIIEEFAIEGVLSNGAAVADYYEFFTGTGHSYVHSANVGKETYFTFLV